MKLLCNIIFIEMIFYGSKIIFCKTLLKNIFAGSFSYNHTENFTMRVSVMASLGGAKKAGNYPEQTGNLVAIDNFVIKMITNDSRGVVELAGQEPETDIEDEVSNQLTYFRL